MLVFIKAPECAIFANDNTLYVDKDYAKLLETQQKECEIALEWFEISDMFVKPDELQSMITSFKSFWKKLTNRKKSREMPTSCFKWLFELL